MNLNLKVGSRKEHMLDTEHAKTINFPPFRAENWLGFNSMVAVVSFTDNPNHPIEILRGCVCSVFPGCHDENVDNLNTFNVYFDGMPRSVNGSEVLTEHRFDFDDPHLLRADEAEEIGHDFEFALEYFGDAFPPDVVRMIVDELCKWRINRTSVEDDIRTLTELLDESDRRNSSRRSTSWFRAD